MKKLFILDTNVLIADPDCLFMFQENDICLPLIVVQELDNLKKRDGSVGYAARKVARHLCDLRGDGSLAKGVQLSSGGKLWVDMDPPTINFPYVGPPINDYYILQTAIEWTQEADSDTSPYAGVILITEDHVMQIMADTAGVRTERYREIAATNKDELYDSILHIPVPQEVIDDIYKVGSVRLKSSYGLDLNEYVVLTSETSPGTALARYRKGLHGATSFHLIQDCKPQRIEGRNKEQRMALDALMDPTISLVCLTGPSGTGKTLLAVAAGLQQTNEDNLYDCVTICRPTISVGKELGFLPGSLSEKLMPWMTPIRDNFEIIFSKGDKKTRSDIFDMLVEQGRVSIAALSMIRGRSMPNQMIILDESQNLSPHEMKTLLTRAGANTKIVLCGDPDQIDAPYLDQYTNGLSYVIDRFRGQDCFATVPLNKCERSKLSDLAAQLL